MSRVPLIKRIQALPLKEKIAVFDYVSAPTDKRAKMNTKAFNDIAKAFTKLAAPKRTELINDLASDSRLIAYQKSEAVKAGEVVATTDIANLRILGDGQETTKELATPARLVGNVALIPNKPAKMMTVKRGTGVQLWVPLHSIQPNGDLIEQIIEIVKSRESYRRSPYGRRYLEALETRNLSKIYDFLKSMIPVLKQQTITPTLKNLTHNLKRANGKIIVSEFRHSELIGGSARVPKYQLELITYDASEPGGYSRREPCIIHYPSVHVVDMNSIQMNIVLNGARHTYEYLDNTESPLSCTDYVLSKLNIPIMNRGDVRLHELLSELDNGRINYTIYNGNHQVIAQTPDGTNEHKYIVFDGHISEIIDNRFFELPMGRNDYVNADDFKAALNEKNLNIVTSGSRIVSVNHLRIQPDAPALDPVDLTAAYSLVTFDTSTILIPSLYYKGANYNRHKYYYDINKAYSSTLIGDVPTFSIHCEPVEYNKAEINDTTLYFTNYGIVYGMLIKQMATNNKYLAMKAPLEITHFVEPDGTANLTDIVTDTLSSDNGKLRINSAIGRLNMDRNKVGKGYKSRVLDDELINDSVISMYEDESDMDMNERIISANHHAIEIRTGKLLYAWVVQSHTAKMVALASSVNSKYIYVDTFGSDTLLPVDTVPGTLREVSPDDVHMITETHYMVPNDRSNWFQLYDATLTVAPAGYGKSYKIREIASRTPRCVILVNNNAQLAQFSGFDAWTIAKFTRAVEGSNRVFLDRFDSYTTVIIDEAFMLSAESISIIMQAARRSPCIDWQFFGDNNQLHEFDISKLIPKRLTLTTQYRKILDPTYVDRYNVDRNSKYIIIAYRNKLADLFNEKFDNHRFAVQTKKSKVLQTKINIVYDIVGRTDTIITLSPVGDSRTFEIPAKTFDKLFTTKVAFTCHSVQGLSIPSDTTIIVFNESTDSYTSMPENQRKAAYDQFIYTARTRSNGANVIIANIIN